MRGVSFLYAVVAGSSFATVLANLGDELRAYDAAYPGLKKLSSNDDSFLKFTAAPDVNSLLDTPSKESVTSASVVSNAYIIQLAAGASLKRRGVRIGAEHFEFHKRASESIDYATRLEFKNPDLFLGLSIQVKDSSNATTIKNIPGVVGVWPVQNIPRPNPVGYRTGDFTDGNMTYHVSASAGPGADVNSPHHMTNVDKLHALGIKGKGMKIALLDTGVDWRHPALGGCFGPGCKISFGKAFVDDDYGETGVAVNSSDPLATCLGGGHGSHTTGIIAMQEQPGSTFGLVGVAPEATVGMYRIFGCDGGADDDIILLALQQAAEDKVDIISISLGSVDRWAVDDPFAQVTASLEAQGIAVIVAAGNNGGPALTSSPAIGEKVIAVGSIDSVKYPTVYTAKDAQGNSFKYSGNPWPVAAPKSGLKVYDLLKLAANTTSPEGCTVEAWTTAAANVPDLSNAIVAAPASSACSWASKINAASEYRFMYSIVYAVSDGGIFVQDYNALEPDIPYYGIYLDADDGQKLLKGLNSTSDYKLYFESQIFESDKQPSANLLSYYSSTGPVSDTLAIKPQLSAPGESILSTWPLNGTGYAILSGTSMSTPYAAGAFALIKSKFPHENVQQLRERMQSNSKTVQYTFDDTIRESVTAQGAGLIDVFSAVFGGSTVSPSELNLGDLDALVPRNFTITNNSPSPKTYTITHEPAGETNLLPYPYTLTIYADPVNLPGQYAHYATVDLSATTVVINPGKSATIVATFHPPTDTPDNYLPVYSGFIKVTSGNDSMTVTYLGQPYSRQKAEYIDHGNSSGMVVPQLLNSHNLSAPILDLGVFDFNLTGLGYPYLLWITLQSIKFWRIELVPYNTTFVPDFYGFSFNDSNPYGVSDSALPLVYPSLPLNLTSAGLQSYGFLDEYSLSTRPSGFVWHLGPDFYDINGYSMGSIPNGDYRAVLRVLRWESDWYEESAYQSWLSPVIRVSVSSNENSLSLTEPPRPGRSSYEVVELC